MTTKTHNDCDLDECQYCRITENMKSIDWETDSFFEIEEVFEDADPMDYL